MQNMSSDTHDHGPPKTIAAQANSVLRRNTPFPQLARWSLNIPQSAIDPLCGAVAGTASGIVTCPLDVIKTKLQAQGAFRRLNPKPTGPSGREMYRGMIGTASTIIRQDGLLGLYRGLSPMLLGYLPTWALYMTGYDRFKTVFDHHNPQSTELGRFFNRAYASVCAGACSTVVTNPIWVIKTRLMSQVSLSASAGARAPWHYSGTLDAARKMYKAEGVAAFYSGLGPAMLGLTHVAIQFPLYEFLKVEFTGLEMGELSEESAAQNYFGMAAATFISKFCATSATYPHEVLRTRMQTQQRHFNPEGHHDGVSSMNHSERVTTTKRVGNSDGSIYRPRYQGAVQTAQMMLREEGWRAFYNGMGTNMIRAIPAALTTMMTFEYVKAGIKRLQSEGQELEEYGS